MGCFNSKPQTGQAYVKKDSFPLVESEKDEKADSLQEYTTQNESPENIAADKAFKDIPIELCPGCLTQHDPYKMLTALGKTWHPECFKCNSCNEVMKPYEEHMLKAGKVYHDDCHYELFGLKCNACNDVIDEEEEYCRAVGKAFHKEHFMCSKCNANLNEQEQIFEVERELFCANDYFESFGKDCVVCRKKIHGDKFVHAVNRYFHPEHFICRTCKKVFPENANYNEYRGGAFCDICYPLLFHDYEEKEIGGKMVRVPVKKEKAEHEAPLKFEEEVIGDQVVKVPIRKKEAQDTPIL